MCLSHTLRGIQAPILPLLPEHPVPSQPSAMPNGIIMLGPKVPGTRCPTSSSFICIVNYKTNKNTRVTCFKETALLEWQNTAELFFSLLIEIYAFSTSQWLAQTPPPPRPRPLSFSHYPTVEEAINDSRQFTTPNDTSTSIKHPTNSIFPGRTTLEPNYRTYLSGPNRAVS
ncbi:hypothetical protein TsFJ059_007154 [Trichoderma semiorbis]|uniref:Uncharacterized protein n=1 Tax=Trichoderma semiorbis TaxID=1491008 RepID=A0A9P8KQ29_9HYPO|nr:hypothetical protein TsFJ059_007154 [Trichoderma semiorbis]